jgi:hypothetical protein
MLIEYLIYFLKILRVLFILAFFYTLLFINIKQKYIKRLICYLLYFFVNIKSIIYISLRLHFLSCHILQKNQCMSNKEG